MNSGYLLGQEHDEKRGIVISDLRHGLCSETYAWNGMAAWCAKGSASGRCQEPKGRHRKNRGRQEGDRLL